MEGMILAAGLGTRLRPLTHDIPKALVEVGGKTMLERTARRLIDAGVDRLIINVHHHADQILGFLEEADHFGVDVRISKEPERALETGGGLKHAAQHFAKEAPFFLHNSDVYTDIDLKGIYRAQVASGALANLAVKEAGTSRYLVFDEADDLCGYGDREGNEHIVRPPSGPTKRYDFCGVQVVSPRIFELMTETGVFSIISTYLRLSQAGERIEPYAVGDVTWIDVGMPDRLESARAMFS